MIGAFLRVWRRIRSTRVAHDIDDELRFHLQMRTEEYERTGAPFRDARRRALDRFGSLETVREACRSIFGIQRRSPSQRGQLMDNLWQDLRYAVRSFARQPSFTLVAIGTLVVGIGANTVIYSAVNSTLLNPIPFEGGDRFIMISHRSPAGEIRISPSSTAIHAWRERASTLEAIATYSSGQMVLRLGGTPQSALGVFASVQLLPFLGVQPHLGRAFTASDTIPGQDRVVLLSERFWRQYYGGRSDVLGTTLHVNDELYTVIGVVPNRAQAFFGRFDPANPLDYAVWLPGANQGTHAARLRPGATVGDALAEATAIHSQLQMEGAYAWPLAITRPAEAVADDLQLALWILLGTVGFVLVLACVNVTNMLLMRGAARGHEIGMRTALGAARGRLLRQFLVESLLLTIAATAAAIGLALLAMQVVAPLLPESLDALQIRMETPVLLVTAGIAAVTSVTFGLIPLGQARTLNLSALLNWGQRSGATTRSRARIRTLLVGVEVALATVLFVGAGLTIRSLLKLNAHDPGFNATNLISFSVELPEHRYAEQATVTSTFVQLLEQLRRVPNVQHAALGAMDGFGFTEGSIVAEGDVEPHPAKLIRTNLISDDYFRTLALELRGGRDFLPQEITGNARQVIVNENFERTYWSGESAIGKRFRFERSDDWYTVIGVARNIELSGLYSDSSDLVLHQPFPRWSLRLRRIVVRTVGDPAAVIPSLKGALWQIDQAVPLRNIEIATDMLANANARPRFNALMLGAFAMIGVTLAAVGVYSVVSLALHHRIHELGIRSALGATESDGVRLMLGHGLRPVIGGIVVGLAGALGLSRFLQSLLFEVQPTDPATYALVAVTLTIAAFAASYIPARRASRVDPVEVLRVQ